MTRLDIVSDPVCPWCYIGKAHLDRALAASGARPFEIRWRPYQLNPDLPPEGMDRRAYLEAKFGGPDGARRVYGRIEAAAHAAGLEVDLGRISRAPNTRPCHRVISAATDGVQDALVAELFRRYFVLGEDISETKVLCAAAERAGMDGAVVARLLAGSEGEAEVEAEVEAMRAMGVTGVPTFVLDGRYVLTGAQPPETWTRVIAERAATTA